MTAYTAPVRDRIACWIANYALNHIASPEYRTFFAVAARRGVEIVLDELAFNPSGKDAA